MWLPLPLLPAGQDTRLDFLDVHTTGDRTLVQGHERDGSESEAVVGRSRLEMTIGPDARFPAGNFFIMD